MPINETVLRSVVSDLMNYASEIRISASSETYVKEMVYLLLHDRAILFHVDEIQYVFYPRKRSAALFPRYNCSLNEYTNSVKEIQQIVTKISQYLLTAKTDYDKELVIHDLLCSKVTYIDEGKHSHTIIGPLLEKRGVCDGISKAAKILFQIAGLDSHIIYGRAKSCETENYLPHAWNLVKANGVWYHMDITFDNTLSHSGIRYDYFNKNSENMAIDHLIDSDSPFRRIYCTSPDNYYSVNGLYFDDVKMLEAFLRTSIDGRKKDIQIKVHPGISEHILKIFKKCINTAEKVSYNESVNSMQNIYSWNINY